MNFITDYYKYKKPVNSKSKTRFELVESTKSYEVFENSKDKKGVQRIYLLDETENIKADKKRKPQKIISDFSGNHLSGVFIPNLNNICYGFGDIRNTNDFFLVLFNTDFTELEIFVCRNKLHNKQIIFSLFSDNEIDEVEFFRNKKVV